MTALLCLLALHCSYDLLFVLSETLERLEGCSRGAFTVACKVTAVLHSADVICILLFLQCIVFFVVHE